eukprot:CAMPEP_0204086364 /NCGR_PEP_ID=MMETSP0360-20130528/182955_1 /ASSEMBLY_ACC=CAM_ASM_000342 /TAXON_ID=268821 /ORGANISM="Scrippsiella Hangoei, Strain SHTV-5" /LENGTH=39 /DNA_ID= /DNA_START= /DNA_END= /DNA_ORIENTATION=
MSTTVCHIAMGKTAAGGGAGSAVGPGAGIAVQADGRSGL